MVMIKYDKPSNFFNGFPPFQFFQRHKWRGTSRDFVTPPLQVERVAGWGNQHLDIVAATSYYRCFQNVSTHHAFPIHFPEEMRH